MLETQRPELESIKAYTAGIIFLGRTSIEDLFYLADIDSGTPHGGSPLASILKSVAWLSDSPIRLVRVLEKGSKSLEQLTKEFEAYYKGKFYSPVRLGWHSLTVQDGGTLAFEAFHLM